jgi:HD-like signal output (HDOD) protein
MASSLGQLSIPDASTPSPVLEEWRTALESRLTAEELELPVLPEVAQSVVAATHDEATTLGKLAELIRRDPALAANVLRLANSSFYGARTPIVSLQQALGRLGLDQIRQIALVIACEGAVFSVPGHLAAVRALFRHALATAVVGGEIARCKRRNVEEAYLGGLLHAVGRPVLLQQLARLERQRGLPAPPELFAVIDANHTVMMTARVLEHWRIAEPIQEALQHLKQPQAAPHAATLATIVALAVDWGRWILDATSEGTRDDAALREHPLNAALMLYPQDVDELLARREALLGLVSDLA